MLYVLLCERGNLSAAKLSVSNFRQPHIMPHANNDMVPGARTSALTFDLVSKCAVSVAKHFGVDQLELTSFGS